MLEQIDGSGTAYYYHADQLGSVRALTNQSGAVAATYAYDAYGNQTTTTGNVYNPLRYAGEYQDSESGFYYLRARYYDPGTQQFLTRDPLVAATEQAYTYANGSPTNAVDPTGRFAWLIPIALGGAIGGAIDLALQLLANDGRLECVNWADVGISALFGALGGFDTPVGLLGGALGAGADLAFQLMGNGGTLDDVNWFSVGLSGVFSAVGAKGGNWAKWGKEIRIGKDLRIAPFGNRTSNQYGRWPHYHRRVELGPSVTKPGQGIGRHRPWENKSTDKSFWDRF